MKIVLASRNKKKVSELETLLRRHTSMEIEVLSLDDIGYTDDIVEDGASFQENALLKAAVPARMGYIGIADDSGLCVDALDGAPGIFSARYAGEHATDAENNQKLCLALENVPMEQRGAAFVCNVVCVLPSALSPDIPENVACHTRDGFRAFSVQGECRGMILSEGRGQDGFGYDPHFYVPSLGKTFAEIDAGQKNQVSHRGHAMRTFCEIFANIFQNQ